MKQDRFRSRQNSYRLLSLIPKHFFEGGCISRCSPLLHLSPLQYGSFPTMMTGFSPGDELKIAINLLLSEWLLAKLWMKMPATHPSRLMTCCLPFYSGLEGEASWTPACCTHSFPLSFRLTMYYYLHAANMLSQTFNSQRRITRKSILSVYYSNIKYIETSEDFLKKDFCSLFDFFFFETHTCLS